MPQITPNSILLKEYKMKKLLLFTLLLLMVGFAFATSYTIGTGTSSTSYSPFYGLYDYGWNKLIYTAAEINTAGLTGPANIYGFGFYAYNTPANYVMLDQKVYVRHSALANYGTATDETGTGYPNSAGFTQVFSADVVYNGLGWYYLVFTTPFAWNGTSNLEILYENWDGDYYSGCPTHTYTATGTNYMTVYKYADTTFPTTVGTRTYNRPNFRFMTQPLDAPVAATLAAPTNGSWAFNDVSLVWNNGQGMASNYDLYLGTSSNPPFLANTTDMMYTPTLSGGSTYYWKVVAKNVDGTAAASPIWSFNTAGTNQLAESFENTTFPPVGWNNPGGFTRSTTTPYHLTAGAYKSTATPAMLYTPMLELTASSELNFMARAGATTGIGRIQIKYSSDGTTWEPIGDPIVMPANSNWNNYVVDLSSLDGNNYYIGFENYSSTTTAAAIYIDYVFGPDIAALVPDPATLVYPTDAGWTFLDGTLSWTFAGSGGIPTSYDVYFGTSSTPPYVVNQTGTTYTPTLAAGTTYYWQIVPRNDTGTAEGCPIWSFKTPAANQLAESFDATTFPPVGWANPGTWSRSTTTPIFYGSASATKSASTTPAILSTPILAITSTSALDFWYRTSSTTGYGLMNIKYSTDRVTWSQIGATISMPTTTEWRHANVALGAIPAGNYFLGFEVLTSTSTSSIYIDHVFGPALAAVAPGPVTLSAPADLATGISNKPTFTWTAPTTGGVPTGYKVYCDTNANPSTLIGDVTGLTYTATTALAYSTTYYWKVVAYNGSGSSADSAIRSFTTIPDPTIYTFPWLEDYGTTGTTFPPANWTRWSGVLADPTVLTSTTSGWGQDNWLNDTTVTPVNWSARMNIYSTNKYWFITPPIQMPGAGYQLEFDIGLTDYASTLPPEDPAGLSGVDDKFIVLIGDGVTWTPANILRQYDNAGSPYVYNNISNLGEHLTFLLDSYTGIKQIAFYGESTVSNADNDFFVDNVMIRQTPAGAPEHVTLTSPADGSTGIWPENVTLAWTPALTGGTPAYYEIYVGADPIDPGIDYYGEYFYESATASLDLSAQTDIDLAFGSTWYWAVLPYNSDGLAPDPDSPEFMVWDFTIIEDPTIVVLPKEEYFDGVTAPVLPYGWTGYVNSTSTSAYVRTYNSTTYAQSAPNSAYLTNSADTAADLRLITPLIDSAIPLNTIKMKFYARSGSAGYPLLVGTVSATDGTGVFTQLQSIDLTATKTEYTVSFADYAGTDQYICFKHGLGGTYRSLYVDNVQLIELLANDLSATNLAGTNYLQAGVATDYVVTVYNEGTAEQSAYTVNLKTGTTTLATLSVTTPLAAGTSAQHTLSWTPATGGVFPIYGEVVLAGDQYASNNATATKEVYVVDNTMTVIPVGDDATTTSAYYVPISMYYKNGVTEELYFTDEMHLQSGTITALVYKNTFVTNLIDKPIKIWLAQTTVTDLSGGWLPAENYTLVFDGTVDFPSGVNYIVIPLDTPFAYTGGTLATRVYRPMDVAYYSTSDKFYYTTNPAHTTRSRYLLSDSTTYDPLAPSAAGTTLGYFPNTMFVVQNAVMQQAAIMSGYVYQQGTTTPIVGATVTLTDERYSTTTDATGFYSFTFWEAHTVTATATKTTYYPQTVTGIALTMGNTVTQNFYLTPMPRVTVSGIINTNDIPGGVSGATITLNGDETYNATSGTGGAFSIPNVLGSSTGLSYTVTVAFTGYQSYSGTAIVYGTNLNLGTITLNEFTWTAYNLVATHEGANARLVWDPAAEPDYLLFDFESDNGGWVGSGYGDWQWTNTYNVANYVYGEYPASEVPPTAAHSGTGLWGTVLYGPYAMSGAWSYLTQTVDLAGFTSPQLRFWRWNNLYYTYDYYYVQVSTDNGTTWTDVLSETAINNAWAEKVVDLSAYVNQTIQIRFAMYATTVVSYAGLYIDDIYIGPPPAKTASAPFSTGNPDRALLNYDVYRLLAADVATPANWTLLNGAVAGTTYLDTGFASVPSELYKWAVKANYTGGLESPAITSNTLGKVVLPTGMTAATSGADVVLSWTAQPGAAYYKVYASDNPFAADPWTYLGYSATATYTITAPAEMKKFYKVTAIAEEALPAKELLAK